MGNRAFLITEGTASVVANDVNDFRYRASLHTVPLLAQVPARCNDRLESQVMVAEGMVEFVIGGSTAIVLAGDFVRVPPGVLFAWRNAGTVPARLLVRCVGPEAIRRALRITVESAA